ncbi:TPA: glycosylhydrolase-like jelly roll fold domain-containing protein [Streptococcus suis]
MNQVVENHLFPFFWQHGEEEDILVDYVEKIYNSGMKALCIESRPHPDFVGEKWWKDVHIILRECQKRDMKVWILDDSHFPTGFANGKIKESYPELKKQYLTMRRFDIVGPFEGARIDASQLKGRPWEVGQTEMIDILGVYLAQREISTTVVGDPIIADTLIDVSHHFKNDTINLDIPVGDWSVFVVFSTHEGGEEATQDYLNPLQAEATQVLVSEVYEKHYEHVGEFFGSTITGFFSDEPRFGNMKGTEAWIGKTDMVLPWKKDFENILDFPNTSLPLLWVSDIEGKEREVRYEFMNKVTITYNENFVKVLADWCQEHGVDYLGHNIEDNGAHARLGYGAGHFFRGQEEQHYSGIDVIGGQIVPGMPYHHDAFQTGGSDGQFYHYALAKLGASASQLYPHKKGRAMCEAFGAYGWNEGLKTMKWIADHLIVRGINYIVPHAFSPKAYPDFDCPPHFYAHGNNPQFPYMSYLTNYMNRLMSLFSGGKHKSNIALFYPAEFEWASRNYMPVEVPARILTQAQLDFEIVPYDLLKLAEVSGGNLVINHQVFETLVIPYTDYIPNEILKTFKELETQGMDLVFIDGRVESVSHSIPGRLVTLDDLATAVEKSAEIKLSNPCKDLVYYHYQKDGLDYWMFFNESLHKVVDTHVHFVNEQRNPVAYDAYMDKYNQVTSNTLKLKPFETIIWIFGEERDANPEVDILKTEVIHSDWKMSYSKAGSTTHFVDIDESSVIRPLNTIEGFDRVSGTVAYEASIEISDIETVFGIDLGRAYEVAEVFINGKSIGVRIAPPYIYEIKDWLRTGENSIRIEVTNTLGTQFRGGLNQYLLIEPFGLTGEVKLLYKNH